MKAETGLSLTAKILAVVLLFTILVHGGTTLYFFYRSSIVNAQARVPIADQAAAAAQLLNAADAVEEELILRALNSPYFIIRRAGEADAEAARPSGLFDRIMNRLVGRAAAAQTVRVDFAFMDRAEMSDALTGARLPVDESVMRFVMELPDGRRYFVVADSPFLSLGMVSRQFANTLFMIILVIGATLFIIRRLVAPLSRFAEAADRLKDDIDSPPLDEREGVRQVQAAARAFNAMQDRLRDLIEERTQMLAAISHDMRSLVTRWGLRAENLEDPELKKRSLADVAELNGMLTQFLDFARSSSDELSLRRIDLGSVTQSICDEFQEEGHDVTCEVAERIVLTTDATALKRIIRNLVSNAVRYAGQARVAAQAGDAAIMLTVCDEGPGMPEDRLADVMRPYVRLENSRNRDTGGVGLGLSIVKTLSERLGARVELSNRDGGGLCASVRFPPERR